MRSQGLTHNGALYRNDRLKTHDGHQHLAGADHAGSAMGM
jgi:hypothetical protein